MGAKNIHSKKNKFFSSNDVDMMDQLNKGTRCCTTENIMKTEECEDSIYIVTKKEKNSSKKSKRISEHPKDGRQLLKEFISRRKLTSLNKKEITIPIYVNNLITESKKPLEEKYKIEKKLAKGAQGTVYLATNIISGQEVAIKVTQKKRNAAVDNLDIKNEIIMLKYLIHPNIVRLFDVYETPNEFIMINEFCKYGELFAQIKRGFTERELGIIMYQIFSALSYCHENSVVHRDVKLENLLVYHKEKVYDDMTGKEIECFWIRLVDFATAKLFSKQKNERTIIGTSYYIAPEVLRNNYNEKCDSWSAGVVLYILLCSHAPFDGKTDKEILDKIRSGKFTSTDPKYLQSSSELRDLLSKLLEVDVDKRIEPWNALMHPWFEKYKVRDLISNLPRVRVEKYLKNLFNYKITSKLQQFIISFIIHNSYHTEENNDVLKIFRLFEKSTFERLTYNDFYEGLCLFRPKEEVDEICEDLFVMLDSDNDGLIEYEEFLRGLVNKEIILTDEKIKDVFRVIDSEGTGFITEKTLKKFFADINLKISNHVVSKFMKEMGESKVTFGTFKKYVINSFL